MVKQLWLRLSAKGPRFWVPLAIVLQLLFVSLYLMAEKTVIFWDYAMYADLSANLFHAPDFWSRFAESFTQNYNLLYALPAQLAYALFGTGRFVFILTQTATIFVLYQLSLAFVLARTFSQPFKKYLLPAFILTALVPFLWFPLLQGYPDHGAAAALLIALGLFMGDKKSWRTCLAGGLCVALAIILRRHYAYAGLALLSASALFDWYRLGFRRAFGLYGLAGVATIGGLFLVEPVYLREMLETDFQALYRSYDRGAAYFGLFALSRVGVDLVLLALAGLILYLRKNQAGRTNLFHALAFVLLWLLLWSAGPAQAADHYLLPVLPILIALGLYGLHLSLKNKRLRYGLLVFLILRSLWGLVLAPQGPQPSDAPTLAPTYMARPPVRDPDFDQLLGLVRTLSITTSAPTDRIVIAGSSFLLNQDKIRAALTDWVGAKETADKLLPVPETDGPAQTPVDAFASGTLYVVPRNPQYHLDPSGQKVVTALWSTLIKMREESTFFERLPDKYKIGDQTIELWRRKTWTPDKLLRGIYLIGEELKYMRPWVVTQMGGGVQMVQNLEDTEIFALVGNAQKAVSLFFMVPLTEGAYHLTGKLQKTENCGPLYIRTRAENMMGQTVFETTKESPSILAGYDEMIQVKKDDMLFVSIDLWGESGTCPAQLKALRVVRPE